MACNWGFVEGDALEEGKWHEFDDETPKQFARTNDCCDVVLIPAKRIALCDLSSNFNHGNLNGKCQERDEDEQPVSEDACENVELPELDESSIELIEKLHKNKDLEDHGVMQQFLRWAVVRQVLWQEPPGFPVFVFKGGLGMLLIPHLIESAAVYLSFLLWILSDVFLAVHFLQEFRIERSSHSLTSIDISDCTILTKCFLVLLLPPFDVACHCRR